MSGWKYLENGQKNPEKTAGKWLWKKIKELPGRLFKNLNWEPKNPDNKDNLDESANLPRKNWEKVAVAWPDWKPLLWIVIWKNDWKYIVGYMAWEGWKTVNLSEDDVKNSEKTFNIKQLEAVTKQWPDYKIWEAVFIPRSINSTDSTVQKYSRAYILWYDDKEQKYFVWFIDKKIDKGTVYKPWIFGKKKEYLTLEEKRAWFKRLSKSRIDEANKGNDKKEQKENKSDYQVWDEIYTPLWWKGTVTYINPENWKYIVEIWLWHKKCNARNVWSFTKEELDKANKYNIWDEIDIPWWQKGRIIHLNPKNWKYTVEIWLWHRENDARSIRVFTFEELKAVNE